MNRMMFVWGLILMVVVGYCVGSTISRLFATLPLQ